MLPANNIGRCRFPILGGFFRITDERIGLLVPAVYIYLPTCRGGGPARLCIFFPPNRLECHEIIAATCLRFAVQVHLA